jgi:hypothetical protein
MPSNFGLIRENLGADLSARYIILRSKASIISFQDIDRQSALLLLMTPNVFSKKEIYSHPGSKR